MTPFEPATRSLMLNSTQRPVVFIEWADRLISRHGLAPASARIWIDLISGEGIALPVVVTAESAASQDTCETL